MPAKRGRPPQPDLRRRILDAAEKLMTTRGLAGITTREIAKTAGCSEGGLYVHFKGRLDLLLAMLEDTLPEMLGPLRHLREQVGKGTPERNLVKALGGIFGFHQHATPRVAALFADPELHAAFRDSLARQDKGPHLSLKALAGYIAAEQKLRRIDRQIDPALAAYLLMSASFFRAFSEPFFGRSVRASWDDVVRVAIGGSFSTTVRGR
jgi:AcrR family transcriptional regulator